MTKLRRLGVYGVVPPSDELIGGLILHGEPPASAIVRLAFEQVSAGVRVGKVLDVAARLYTAGADLVHEDQIRFELAEDARATLPPPVAPPAPGRPRNLRFAAYGLVHDPAGRMLFTRISPGYPGAGRWHLPGGGTDFGEQPAEGLLREVYEEAGQRGDVGSLIGVHQRRTPAALGPEGHPIDWHGVRAVYRVLVPEPVEPSVTEATGGSTDQAAWFEPDAIGVLDLTDVARWAISHGRPSGD